MIGSVVKGTCLRQVVMVVLVGCACLGLAGGPVSAGPPDDASLVSLDGGLAWVRYAHGSLDRAAHVHDWLETMARGFGNAARLDRPLGVYLLERGQWEESGRRRPYGLPEVVEPGRLALPAVGDPETVDRWRGLLGGRLPFLAGTPIRGTTEEAASLLAADRLGQLEVARSLVGVAGFRAGERWLTDLVAHVALRSPEVLGVDDGFFQDLARANGDRAAPLAAYDDGVAFRTWLWFQGRFDAAAAIVLEKDPKRALRRFGKLQDRNGGTLTAGVLVDRYPRLGAWIGELPEAGEQ